MQNVATGTVSDSDKDKKSQNSNANVENPDKCKTYADLQDKFCTSSGDSESEEDISEVESFVLGEEDEAVGADQILCGENPTGLSNSSLISNNNKFLLSGAHGASAADFCTGECGNGAVAQSLHHHHHSQPQFDPDTQARLVALLEAAVSSSSDPEVLRRLTSSVSSALDEAAAALTRMRTDTGASGSSATAPCASNPGTVGGSSSNNNSCSSSGSDSNLSSSSSSSSTSRSSSSPSGGGTRTLVEACTDGDILTVRKLLDEGRSVHETTEDGESLLSLTCSAGYFDLAQVLIAMRANIEDRGIKGDCTPLMEAASSGHVEIVKLLLAHNAEVNAQSASGNTPLMYACGGGHTNVVKVLLDHGANVEDHNENGHTPLMEAASAGHVEVAKLLLNKGAGINTSSNEFKESALTLACYKGHLDMVKFLLEAGADQEHKTDEMHTALMEASMDGHVEVARLLLDSGAQVNMPADSFESPLTLAACGGHTDLALLLLERGASIEEVNDEGYTPLMEAAREGHDEMVKLLIAHDADINSQTEETQETALTLACCGGFKEVASTLIKAGADMEIGASTPLMEASQEGHKDLVKYLLDVGCNPNCQTSTADTALTYAAENGHTDVVMYLVRAGALIEHESEGGRTPLMKACRAGHYCTVQFLCNQGAEINKPTSENDHTPLSLACSGGHVKIVEYLLAIGADPTHRLKDNTTMLMEASKGGHVKVVQLLMDYPNSIAGMKAQLANQAAEAAASAAALQAETMGTVVENPSPNPMAVNNLAATSAANQFALGLSVMPSSNDHTHNASSSLVLNAPPNSRLGVIPEIDGSLALSQALSQQQKNVRVSKAPKKCSTNLGDNHLQTFKDSSMLDPDGKGASKFLETLKKEVEASATSLPNDSDLVKHQLMQQMQKIGKHTADFVGMACNPDGRVLSSSLENQANMYSTGSPMTSPISHNTVETQTGFLPSSGWNVLPHGLQINEIASSLKSPLYGSPPLSFSADGTPQLPSAAANFAVQSTPTGGLQEGLAGNISSPSSVYLSPTSPPITTSASATSPPNIPVQERRKMVPTKKQLDKKKLQRFQQEQQTIQQRLQQQTIQQYSSQLLQESQQHPCVMQSLDNYNCMSNQSLIVPPPIKMLEHNESSVQPIDVESSSAGKKQCICKIESRNGISHCAAASCPCDCGMHVTLENYQHREDNILEPATSSGTEMQMNSSGLGAAQGNNLRFVPTSGIVSSQHLHFTPFQMTSTGAPLQYGHLQGANQSVAPPTSSLQVTSVSNVAPIAATAGKSAQVKQYLLQQQQSSSGQRGTGQPVTPTSPQQMLNAIQTPHHLYQHTITQQKVSENQVDGYIPSAGPGGGAPAKKTKKNNTGMKEQGVCPQNIDQQQLGMTIEKIENMQQMYSNSMAAAHYPGAPLPCANAAPYAQNLQVNEPGLMVASPATPAKLLNEQMPDIITQSTQVSGPQVGIPYTGTEGALVSSGGVLFPGPGGTPYQNHSVEIDHETDSNHDTALTLACAGGHEDLVLLLLQRGSNIEHCDKKGFTPLILAATAGHAKVVELLINNNANIEAQSERTKDTPLSLACSGGRYEVVEVLIQRNANKEHRNVSDYTPLSLAASGGYVNIIKLLLDSGAEINSRTGSKLGISPLMLAAMNGHVQAVRMLLDMGSDINAQIETNRNTALTLACFQGRHEVVALLVDRKANVEHRAKTGLTPLMEAASGGYVEVGKVLIDKGADVNAPPVPSSRDTALTIAADKGHLKFVELLISNGALTEVKNKKGNSPMWLAANGGHLEVVQALLNAKTNINSEDNRKVTCIMAAFKKGHLKLVKFMVKHVSQFPSDMECNRYICTVTEEELKKRCKACSDIINTAKAKQAAEANMHANSLLDLLEKEKITRDFKRALAMRKKENKKETKKSKIQEKKNNTEKKKNGKQKEENDEDGDMRVPPKGEVKKCDEKPKNVPSKKREERVLDSNPLEERDGDSGIDSNSQTSASSETTTKPPEEKEASGKGKKKKKKKDTSSVAKENNKSLPATNNINSKQRKTTPPPTKKEQESFNKKTNTNSSTSHSNSNINNNSITSNNNKSKKKKDKQDEPKQMAMAITTDINLNMYGNMKPVGGKKNANQDLSSRVNALDTFGEIDHFIPCLSTLSVVPNNKSQIGLSPKKLGRREDGWKEVSRKSKRVSVPSNAISRVIGRGGCNINTIREVSAAHIEVEKQGKSQGDRMIIIKGSTEATRQAQNLINALVKDPDKDLSELIPKNVSKVPPKPPKTLVSACDTISLQKSSYKLTSTTVTITSTVATSIYSSAKTGITTVSAWANIASPKRTPINLNSRTPLLAPSLSGMTPKSPAVRQLFPGDKKGLLGSSPGSAPLNETPITFASKLAENKISKNVPHLMPNSALINNGADNDYKMPDLNNFESNSSSGTTDNKNEYRIFDNILGNVTNEVAFGAKEKPLNFARAASEGLAINKIPLGQQQQVQLSANNFIEEIKQIDASRAVGYRGPVCSSASGGLGKPRSHSPITTMANNVTIIKNSLSSNSGNRMNSPSRDSNITSPLPSIPTSGMNTLDPITPSELIASSSSIASSNQNSETSPPIPPSVTSLARSAPGTPIGSPSSRSIGHAHGRQTSTPPPIQRPHDNMHYNSLVGASRTPPPVPSLMRMQVAPPPSVTYAATGGTMSTSRTQMSPPASLSSFTNGMYITPPPPSSTSTPSIASLAPGGPVMSQRIIPDRSGEGGVNLAVGQPYRKSQLEVTLQQQQQVQQQAQQQLLLQQQQQQFQQNLQHQQNLQQQVNSGMHGSHLQQQVQQQQQQEVVAHPSQQSNNAVVHQQLQHQVAQTAMIQNHHLSSQHQSGTAGMHSSHLAQQQNQQAPHMQQQQHYSQTVMNNLASLMGASFRLTAPQTTTTPVFTNSIIAPISAAPHIQSNLNPNAPDFASRNSGGFVANFSPRSQQQQQQQQQQQLAYQQQNGMASATPSLYSGVGYGALETGIQLQPNVNEVLNLLPHTPSLGAAGIAPSTAATLTLRSVVGTQDGSAAVHSPPQTSNPSSPTQQQCVTVGGAGGNLAGGGGPYAHLFNDDRHSKLQPIGTERAQKRVGNNSTVVPTAMGVMGNVVGVSTDQQLLWARQDMLAATQQQNPQVEAVLQPANVYFAAAAPVPDVEVPTFNNAAQLWNWTSDTNR